MLSLFFLHYQEWSRSSTQGADAVRIASENHVCLIKFIKTDNAQQSLAHSVFSFLSPIRTRGTLPSVSMPELT